MFVKRSGATAEPTGPFHYVADSSMPRGYSKRPGTPDLFMRPWSVNVPDGRVIYSDIRNPPGARHKAMVEYSRDLNLERRALAETALATAILHNPHLVGAVLNKVSSGITRYWQARRKQLGHEAPPVQPTPRGGYYSGRPMNTPAPPPTNPVAWQALQGTETYTHGPTSYGRLDTAFPARIEQGVRQELAALYGNSIPQTINVHDNFLRLFGMLGPADLTPDDVRNTKWLAKPRDPGAMELQRFWNERSADWKRLKVIEGKLRPGYLFDRDNPEPRGRSRVGKGDPGANNTPGLLPNVMPAYLDEAWKRLRIDWFGGRTLPVEKEARRRGMELYNPAEGSDFIREVRAHNLMFAAGQSGTTSTLFQAAIFFGDLSGEDLKTYLMAAVGYLVAGGMHSCHEMFKTATLVGIPYDVGGYEKAIPDHIRKHAIYKDWIEEFADIVGPSKYRTG